MSQYYLSFMKCEYDWWVTGITTAIKCILLNWYGRIPGVCCHSIQSSLHVYLVTYFLYCLCSIEYEGSSSCHILYITSEMIACGSLCTWQEWPGVPWLHCSHAAVKIWIILWLVNFCFSLHIQYGIPLFYGCLICDWKKKKNSLIWCYNNNSVVLYHPSV